MLTERSVEVGGVPVRYREAGQGAPLVHVHGAGDPSTPAHDLLTKKFRVIALEAPPRPGPEAAAAIGRTLTSLGVEAFDLLATADAGASALWLALGQPERVRGLVLESPTALDGGAAELAHRLAEVTTPTLVVFGTGDRLDVQQTGRVYAEQLPEGHLVFVYDAARDIGRDRPEAFAEVVIDFLERHEAFIINRASTVIHP